MKSKLNLAHTTVGIATTLIFIGTGLLMRFHFTRVYESNHLIRMMFRSIHIYILLAGLLNIALGIYMSSSDNKQRRAIQLFGSICILAAPVLLIIAFFYEPVRGSLEQRHLTLLSIILLLVGTTSHLLAGLGTRAADRQRDK